MMLRQDPEGNAAEVGSLEAARDARELGEAQEQRSIPRRGKNKRTREKHYNVAASMDRQLEQQRRTRRAPGAKEGARFDRCARNVRCFFCTHLPPDGPVIRCPFRRCCKSEHERCRKCGHSFCIVCYVEQPRGFVCDDCYDSDSDDKPPYDEPDAKYDRGGRRIDQEVTRHAEPVSDS